jgi:2-phosphosulfolactate phosphatase
MASEGDIRERTVVVIDTLRATSTIVEALTAGAREVVPAAAADEAVQIAHRLGTDRTLLCGERGARKISGFHLGNSPREYTPEVVAGKTLVLTTTNGTGALLRCRTAARVLIGSLLNAGAVARAVSGAGEVTILCAGTNGGLSLEDVITAGAIVDEIASAAGVELNGDDGARAAQLLFGLASSDLAGTIGSTDHGKILRTLGMEDDILFCSRLNYYASVVPELTGSTIRLREA